MPALDPDALDRRREALLMAAFRCFGRKGYRATSMRDICAEAGVSIGGLYCHYNSKEEIIAGVARLISERRARVVATPADDDGRRDPSAGIAAAMRALFTDAYGGDRDALLGDVSLVGEAIHIPALKAILQNTDREQIDALSTLLEPIEGLDDDLKSNLARLLTAAGYGLIILAAYHEDFDPDTCITALERLLDPLLKPAPMARDRS